MYSWPSTPNAGQKEKPLYQKPIASRNGGWARPDAAWQLYDQKMGSVLALVLLFVPSVFSFLLSKSAPTPSRRGTPPPPLYRYNDTVNKSGRSSGYLAAEGVGHEENSTRGVWGLWQCVEVF